MGVFLFCRGAALASESSRFDASKGFFSRRRFRFLFYSLSDLSFPLVSFFFLVCIFFLFLFFLSFAFPLSHLPLAPLAMRIATFAKRPLPNPSWQRLSAKNNGATIKDKITLFQNRIMDLINYLCLEITISYLLFGWLAFFFTEDSLPPFLPPSLARIIISFRCHYLLILIWHAGTEK